MTWPAIKEDIPEKNWSVKWKLQAIK